MLERKEENIAVWDIKNYLKMASRAPKSRRQDVDGGINLAIQWGSEELTKLQL